MNNFRHTASRYLCTSSSQHAQTLPKLRTQRKLRNIVLVDGVRTPFLTSWTHFKDMTAHDLQRIALDNLCKRIGINKREVEYICVGNVLQDPHTPNLAKEAAIGAGFADTTPAHTVTMACISAMQAVTSCIGLIQTGNADCCIGGGAEFISDPCIRYSRPVRSLLTEIHFARSFGEKAKILMKLDPKTLKPDIPSITEFSTNETMGHFCDRLAASFKISRSDQDAYSLRSNTLAKKAFEDGNMTDITPVKIPQSDQFAFQDNGVRVSSLEKMGSLKPSFVKPHGTVTAANSSFLSDGAAACLICSEEKALELGLKPKAYLREFNYVSNSCKDQLLLGPSHSIPQVLNKSGLTKQDIGVWEIHEAFAGQILANLSAMNSDYFTKNHTQNQHKIGEIPMDKLNLWGGSVSLGHPFGATGVRLLMHAANRLIKEDEQIACVSACAAGGHGASMILERYPGATEV